MTFPGVRSKSMILLLLIYCIFLPPLFVSGFLWSLTSYAVLSVISSYAINFLRKREAVVPLSLSFCSHVLVSVLRLPHGAVCWSAVCECDIVWSYTLRF